MEQQVVNWIEERFDTSALTIEDFPLFPAGKIVKDRTGAQLLVYFDILTGQVVTNRNR